MQNKKYWHGLLVRTKDRLSYEDHWFPFPFLLPLMLFLCIYGQFLPDLNPRRKNLSHVLHLKGDLQPKKALWLAISPYKNSLLINTSDQQDLLIPQKITKPSDLAPLKSYLTAKMQQIALSATLEKEADPGASLIILAVDKTLKYYHLRPFLYILAEVGISEYAFETLVPEEEENS